MNGNGGAGSGLLAAIGGAGLAIWFGYKAVAAYTANPAPWLSAGIGVLAFAGLFLLWWIFGESSPSGLQIARKAVGKLEEEEQDRAAGISLAWLLFGGAVILVLAVMLGGR